MRDHIDRAADLLWDAIDDKGIEGRLYRQDCRYLAQALDKAGLLAKYPHLEIEGDWLIEVVDYHTCGAGPGSGAGHEPGCGTIPVGRLASPERDAEIESALLDRLKSLADGFHFAGDLSAERSLRGWIADTSEKDS